MNQDVALEIVVQLPFLGLFKFVDKYRGKHMVYYVTAFDEPEGKMVRLDIDLESCTLRIEGEEICQLEVKLNLFKVKAQDLTKEVKERLRPFINQLIFSEGYGLRVGPKLFQIEDWIPRLDSAHSVSKMGMFIDCALEKVKSEQKLLSQRLQGSSKGKKMWITGPQHEINELKERLSNYLRNNEITLKEKSITFSQNRSQERRVKNRDQQYTLMFHNVYDERKTIGSALSQLKSVEASTAKNPPGFRSEESIRKGLAT